MTKVDDEFEVSPDGVTHLPTEARFTPNPGMPTTGFWRDGKLGTPAGQGYVPDEVKDAMRRLWAEHLLNV
jgi:hypothetical protein